VLFASVSLLALGLATEAFARGGGGHFGGGFGGGHFGGERFEVHADTSSARRSGLLR